MLHFYDVSSCDGGEIIMQTVPLSQLKSDLSQLIHLVEAGEDIAITRRGALVARLVPYNQQVKSNRADLIRSKRTIFNSVPAFDEREITAEGRKW